MSFAISGFGALQYRAAPQIFQALSLAGAGPVPPAPQFGSPNQTLVPVSQASSNPLASLSLQAQPAAEAVAGISVSIQGLRSGPLTTAFAGARNANVLAAGGAPGTLDGIYGRVPPEGPVAFNVRASNPATVAKIVTTIANLAVAAVYPKPVFSFSA